jgi:hypothetical protein
LAEQTDREKLALRYLLGGLSETERATLEERFLSDDAAFEELEIAEGELIDRYVRKELTESDHKQFQKLLLTSPRLVERVEFARILASRISSAAPQESDPQPEEVVERRKNKPAKARWWTLFGPTTEMAPAMRVAWVLPLALFLLTSVALVLGWMRYRAESQRWTVAQQQVSQLDSRLAEEKAKTDRLELALRQTEQERTEQVRLVAEVQQQLDELRQQIPTSVFSFFLNPGSGTRGGGNSETPLRIPPGSSELELRLNVDAGDYSLYNASLQDVDRKPIAQRPRLKAVRRGGRKYIPFKIAAKLLRPGSYYIHVDGLKASGEPEDFNDYPFRVTSR